MDTLNIWRRLVKSLNKKEFSAILILLIIVIFTAIFWGVNEWSKQSQLMPAYGGQYIEGIVGKLPTQINPILISNDVERDLTELIFSSLVKYDGQGNLIPDLAYKYEIDQDQKTYTFYLREDIFFHDGQPLTADDVLFTVEKIKDPLVQSPLRPNFQGVEIEKIDSRTVRFKLKNVYYPFLHSLSFGILSANLPFDSSPPIGTGPFQFKSTNNQSIQLVANQNYYLQKPYLNQIIFHFYPDEKSMALAYQQRSILGLSFISPANLDKIQAKNNLSIYSLPLPRYFALFFNQTKNKDLARLEIRQALALATDKQALIEEILNGHGQIIDTPLLEQRDNQFNPEKAKEILDDLKPEFILTTSDWPELVQVAQLLKEQWQKVGIKTEIQIIPANEIQQNYIQPREYEALLFGEILGPEPDPFAFWHSSQINAPGLNLSLYSDKKVDKLLEEARQSPDQKTRQAKFKEFQEIIAKDIPAIFLYSPDYLYGVNKKIKGIELTKIHLPSKRFSQVNQWYIKTKKAR